MPMANMNDDHGDRQPQEQGQRQFDPIVRMKLQLG